METEVVLLVIAAVLFSVAVLVDLVGEPRLARAPFISAGLLALTLALIVERT